MEEQFCTYSISLKLKELGFDEPCLAYYSGETLLSEFVLDYSKTVFYTQTNNGYEISAPLWQQAISFLKEKDILVAERWDGWEYGAYEWDDFIYTDTKEQAILKAIELISK